MEEIVEEENLFKDKVFLYLDNISMYNKKQIKNNILNIYKDNKFKFPLNNNDINKIIYNFLKYSIKFTKQYMFVKDKDNKGKDFLRECNYFLGEIKNKKKEINARILFWQVI